MAIEDLIPDWTQKYSGAAAYGFGPDNAISRLRYLARRNNSGQANESEKKFYQRIQQYVNNRPSNSTWNGLRKAMKSGDFAGVQVPAALGALDYGYRESSRKSLRSKQPSFLEGLVKNIAPAVAGSLILPGIGSALGASISSGVGGAVGGALAGGIQDGFKGAALGGLSGYGIGSGVGAVKDWATNALTGGGFVDPSALGYSGTDLYASPALGEAATTAAGIGNPSGVIGNALTQAGSGLVAGFEGLSPSLLYNPQSMGGPAPSNSSPFNAYDALNAMSLFGGPQEQYPQLSGGTALNIAPTASSMSLMPVSGNNSLNEQFQYALRDAMTGKGQAQGFDATQIAPPEKVGQRTPKRPGYQTTPFANALVGVA